MSDLLLNGSGDLDLSDFELQLVEGSAAVAQEIKIAVLTFLGEWFLDTRRGFPWFERVFVKNPKISELQTLIARAIRAVPGVLEVPDVTIDLDADTRRASIAFSAKVLDDEQAIATIRGELLLPVRI